VRRQLKTINDPSHASLRVQADHLSAHPIPAHLTGKFAEHLGANIYHGMDAQILRNPTLADYPFWNGQMSPDGITQFHGDSDRINRELRQQSLHHGWPESELDALVILRCAWPRLYPW
jgi:hypothetical protein